MMKLKHTIQNHVAEVTRELCGKGKLGFICYLLPKYCCQSQNAIEKIDKRNRKYLT